VKEGDGESEGGEAEKAHDGDPGKAAKHESGNAETKEHKPIKKTGDEKKGEPKKETKKDLKKKERDSKKKKHDNKGKFLFSFKVFRFIDLKMLFFAGVNILNYLDMYI
jgi:hypothetical protein